jgi:RDD family
MALRPAIKMNLLRGILAVWFLLGVCLPYFFAAGETGYSFHSKDGVSQVSAGSSPVFLAWSFIAIILFIAMSKMKADEIPAGIPSLLRRSAAFFIDFSFSLAILTSVGGLVPLLIEAARTGHFVWQFARDYSVASDELVGIPLVLLMMALMFLYFAWPLTKGKQTVGCFILRLRTTPPFGDRGAFTSEEAIRRVWFEIRGSCSFLWLRKSRDSQGRTWYDRETNCTVVLIKYE